MGNKYQVIEDNAGGMYLFMFDILDGTVILGIENIENVEPGDLEDVDIDDVSGWDSQLHNPQDVYDEFLNSEFGYEVVADQNEVYPDRMGRAAQMVFNIED